MGQFPCRWGPDSAFGNQAEDVGSMASGMYQIVSELGGLVLGTLFFSGVVTALLQEASGYEARGSRLRNELRTPTVAPDFSGLILSPSLDKPKCSRMCSWVHCLF